jgi:hypothetical protein
MNVIFDEGNYFYFNIVLTCIFMAEYIMLWVIPLASYYELKQKIIISCNLAGDKFGKKNQTRFLEIPPLD